MFALILPVSISSEVAISTLKMRNVLIKSDGRKIVYYIISRLGAAAVQKGRFGRPYFLPNNIATIRNG